MTQKNSSDFKDEENSEEVVDIKDVKGKWHLSSVAKNRRGLVVIIFVLLMILVFIYKVFVSVSDKYEKDNPEAVKNREMKNREIVIDNYSLFQAQASQKILNLEESNKTIQNQLKSVEENVGKNITSVQKQIADSTTQNQQAQVQQEKKFDTFKKEIKDELKKNSQEITGLITQQNILVGEKVDQLDKGLKDIEKKTQDLEKKQKEAPKIMPVPEIKDDASSLPSVSEKNKQTQTLDKTAKKEGKNKGKKEKGEGEAVVDYGYSPFSDYGVQIVYEENTMSYDGDTSKQEGRSKKNEPKRDEFIVPVGVAEGQLFTGGEAKIAGFGNGDDENIAVGITLLSNMTIANKNYKQVKDCLLIGTAKGDLGTNRAHIRLSKISCLFEDENKDLYIAEGGIIGWVYGENSSIGVSGRLISKEGKIIMSSLPLTLLQAGIDYLTRSATSINILGSSDLSTSLGAGLSNGANTSLEKLTSIYEKYLDALTPAISFRAGRKVSILFNGGESIPLRLYKKNDGNREGIKASVDTYMEERNKGLFEEQE